ncbi:hypothetical protein FHR93_004142 [Geodermatophilus sabuli]|nr:hypothetical protein [Geodermatophilus sabuli]
MALLVAAAVLVGVPASAAETALLRVAHLSPDTPAVDLAVTPLGGGDPLSTRPGVGYGALSEYQEVPPGGYAVSVRAVGAAPGSPPVLSVTVDAPAGAARTVAAVGSFAGLRLVVLDDDLTPPPTGSARVRVVAAARTPSLDVSAGAVAAATDLGSGEVGPYVAVPAGATTLQLRAGESPAEVPVELAAGSVYNLLVLDGPDGGLTVRTVLDAAGAAVVPTGGVETGAGGTAGGSALPAVLAAAVLVPAVLAVLRLRLRARTR